MCNAMQKYVLCEWPLKLCPNHDKAKSHSIWLTLKLKCVILYGLTVFRQVSQTLRPETNR